MKTDELMQVYESKEEAWADLGNTWAPMIKNMGWAQTHGVYVKRLRGGTYGVWLRRRTA
jgi:hypothetical protein